ncbi:MAG: 4'-phosphopantetheinyl transferase superfamily protein [Legionellaceae bacterium]|nr:4'-phosphopantetheinyl transferase superfamily protein [Legionellaceae bacterium]
MKNTLVNENLRPNEHQYSQSICNHFQPFTIDDCNLSENRIDIWQYPLTKMLANADDILSESERDRASKFYFERHRRRFKIAHAILRLILSRYLQNKNPNQLEFTENKYGKPELVNNVSLRFNLSHSGDLALLAIGQKHPLGVDLETFSSRPYQEIGQAMFSKTEIQSLKHIHKSQVPITFFRIWSQKEAFIKAVGQGLSYPTQKFDVLHTPSLGEEVYDFQDNSNWLITSFMPTITCCGAICYKKEVNNIRHVILDNSIELT